MSDVDPHRRTAALMLDKPEDQVTAPERVLGKTMNAFVAWCLACKLPELETRVGLTHDEAYQVAYSFSSNVLGMTPATD